MIQQQIQHIKPAFQESVPLVKRVCYKDLILIYYTNKVIAFDEAKLKIKQIQHNEQNEDIISFLQKKLEISIVYILMKIKAKFIEWNLQSENCQMVCIIEPFKNDRIS